MCILINPPPEFGQWTCSPPSKLSTCGDYRDYSSIKDATLLLQREDQSSVCNSPFCSEEFSTLLWPQRSCTHVHRFACIHLITNKINLKLEKKTLMFPHGFSLFPVASSCLQGFTALISAFSYYVLIWTSSILPRGSYSIVLFRCLIVSNNCFGIRLARVNEPFGWLRNSVLLCRCVSASLSGHLFIGIWLVSSV